MPDQTIILTADVSIQAATGKGPPKVSIVGYGGSIMAVPGWGNVVIDLAGLTLSGSVPILSDHDAALRGVVGSGVPTIDRGRRLLVNGTIAPVTEAATTIIALAKSGVAFQASVGVQPEKHSWVHGGETLNVNNQQITATGDGFTLVSSGRLREVSIVAVGADESTSVSIAASLKGKNMSTDNPTPTTPSFDPMLQAAWENPALTGSEKILARWNAAQFNDAAVRSRIEPDLHAALSGAISFDAFDARVSRGERDDAQLKAMRDERPKAPPIYGSRSGAGNVDTPQVLEAALLKHMGRESLGEKVLGADTMMRGADLGCRSLVDVMAAGLRLTGHDVPRTTDAIIKAAYSTIDLSGILGNTANKVMLDAYRAFPSVARLIAKKLSAKDFKGHTGYRLTGDSSFALVAPAGEITHGTLGESSYSFRVDTYARMFGLTRQDIQNDDLGAFSELPQLIGRGCATKVESLFWTLVLANTDSFYDAGNGNYNDGADSALGITGLGNAVTLMRQQTDSQGEPILVEPKYLVVPPELEATADQLYASTNVALVMDSTADATSQMPDGNPYKGKYTPKVVPHLSNESYTNYSATAWYLFGDPGDVASFGLAYLNGMEQPIIEAQDAPFNTLGMQWRGYLDVGVCQIDAKGSVMSAGA